MRPTRYGYLVVMVSCLLGCGSSGPPMATISGTVTFDGKPLTDATLQVDPNDGSIPAMIEISNGMFSGRARVGKQTLRFSAVRIAKTPRDPAEGLKPPHENILPPKYGFQSEITLEVVPDGNLNLVYELVSD